MDTNNQLAALTVPNGKDGVQQPAPQNVARIAVSGLDEPYKAIGHFDLEGQKAATLEFGPLSSQVAITAAHVLNTIIYGEDQSASYSDERGNKANIVAIYLPKDYDAQEAENHGKFFDRAIVVFDRPIPDASHFQFTVVDAWDQKVWCDPRENDDMECKLAKPLPINQAGYPADRFTMIANMGGAITGFLFENGHAGAFLLEHSLHIFPGDSGSAAWNSLGALGIVQSNNYVTPLTQAFIDCYNGVVKKVEATPPAPSQVAASHIQIFRAEM